MERDNQDLYTKSVAGAEEENPGKGGKITTTENLCCLGCLCVGIESWNGPINLSKLFFLLPRERSVWNSIRLFPLLIIAVIYRRITLRFRCHGSRVRLFWRHQWQKNIAWINTAVILRIPFPRNKEWNLSSFFFLFGRYPVWRGGIPVLSHPWLFPPAFNLESSHSMARSNAFLIPNRSGRWDGWRRELVPVRRIGPTSRGRFYFLLDSSRRKRISCE